MSKHHYAATVREIQELVTVVSETPEEDLEQDHGIKLLPNGKVLDLIDNITYASLTDWAQANIELSNSDYEVGMENRRNKFDDE